MKLNLTQTYFLLLSFFPILLINAQTAYIGCFQDNGDRILKNYKGDITQLTPSLCITKCRLEGSDLAGVENSVSCYCGDSMALLTASRLDDSRCNAPCDGDPSKKCGGFFTISIYEASSSNASAKQQIQYKPSDFIGSGNTSAVAPNSDSKLAPNPQQGNRLNYIGCYLDSGDRVLKKDEGGDGQMTPGICMEKCRINGYEVAGIETASSCFCGPLAALESASLQSDSLCNMACVGDPNLKCGGNWALSVYLVGQQPKIQLNTNNGTLQLRTSIKITTMSGTQAAYLGCYDDSGPRILRTFMGDESQMTPSICVERCSLNGFDLAGVEHGSVCYCGPQVALNIAPLLTATRCYMPCTGDFLQRCGGDGTVSIYQILRS